jgi:hypothetical protein
LTSLPSIGPRRVGEVYLRPRRCVEELHFLYSSRRSHPPSRLLNTLGWHLCQKMENCPIGDRQTFLCQRIIHGCGNCLAEFDEILTFQWGGSESGRPFLFGVS